MGIYANIPERLTRIVGHPHSGWRGANAEDSSDKALPFYFVITDDGNENFLLVYHSLDKVFCADSWHETLDDAFAAANKGFGIAMSEWKLPTSIVAQPNPKNY